MCSEQKFYICKHCKKIIGVIRDTGVPTICCGEPMNELVPNTVDASQEKHLPVVTVSDDKITVEVGSVLHPMTEEHHIEWIYLQTKNGGQRKCIALDDEPIKIFSVYDDEPVAAFAYCNLHGLWKTEIK